MKATRAALDAVAVAAIYRVLQRQFVHWRKRLLINLHTAWAERPDIAKANGSPLWMWVDGAINDSIDQPSDTSMRDVADAMVKAHSGAAGHVIKQIDISDPLAVSLRTNTEAVNFAAARSAEMIGQVSDTTRKVLRQEITDAVGLHWDVDKLADRLEQTSLFIDQRSAK
jgi:hypothetical protein